MAYADNVIEAMHPVMTDDLAKFITASAQMFSEIDQLARDTPTDIGWSVILDVDRIPAKGLPWLAQWVGVENIVGLDEPTQRALIKAQPNRRRGTKASIIAAAQENLIGTKTVILRERIGGAYRFEIITKTSETPVEEWDVVNLYAGPALPTTIAAGNDYLYTNYIAVPGSELLFAEAWVKTDAFTDDDLGNGWTGIDMIFEYAIDAVFYQIPSSQNRLIPNGKWQRIRLVGLIPNPGIFTIDTPRLYFYKETPNIVHVKDIYIGFGGSQATPQSGPLWNSVIRQKPAGLKFTHTTLEGQDFQTLLDHNPLFSNVYATYATFDGVLRNIPGA